MSVSAFSANPLDDAPKRREDSEPKPFRLVTVRGSPRPGIDLDRPRAFEIEEDAARYGRS